MTQEELERRLHGEIPLSAAMGVRVLTASPKEVRLVAPLKPNVNHMRTVFGGSAAAVATLAAWSLLVLKLEDCGRPAKVLIQRSHMEYQRSMESDFEALCRFEDEIAWQRFQKTLERHGRARLPLSAVLLTRDQERTATFQGDFVAVAS
jgi:thioesterase domain-containing protein